MSCAPVCFSSCRFTEFDFVIRLLGEGSFVRFLHAKMFRLVCIDKLRVSPRPFHQPWTVLLSPASIVTQHTSRPLTRMLVESGRSAQIVTVTSPLVCQAISTVPSGNTNPRTHPASKRSGRAGRMDNASLSAQQVISIGEEATAAL